MKLVAALVALAVSDFSREDWFEKQNKDTQTFE